MNDKLVKVLHHPVTIPTAVGVVSFLAGCGAGIFFERRRINSGNHEVPATLDLALESLRREEETVADIPENVRAREFIENVLHREEKELESIDEPDDDEEDVIIVGELAENDASESILINHEAVQERNIFAGSDDADDWDYETELGKRSDEVPYILHADEFHAQEKDYPQTSVVYFEGDDILADEDLKPVYNFRSFVGEFQFGHGSGDPNICFVRNDKRKVEYEIIRDPGMFSLVVQGLEIEDNQRVKDLKHSHAPMKFRDD